MKLLTEVTLDNPCVCGETKGYIKQNGIHMGLYCNRCNKWQKWINKTMLKELFNNNESDTNIVYSNIDIEALEKQRELINIQISNYYTYKNNISMEHNKRYIGKTYKKKFHENHTEYLKIINVDKNNMYRMIVLSFNLPVTYSEYNATIGSTKIENKGLLCKCLDDTNKLQIDSYTEISNDEFLKAREQYEKEINSIINK